MGSAASLLRPEASNRSSPSMETSSTTVDAAPRATSAAHRATAGPHIIPAPPADATTTRSNPGAAPMIGR